MDDQGRCFYVTFSGLLVVMGDTEVPKWFGHSKCTLYQRNPNDYVLQLTGVLGSIAAPAAATPVAGTDSHTNISTHTSSPAAVKSAPVPLIASVSSGLTCRDTHTPPLAPSTFTYLSTSPTWSLLVMTHTNPWSQSSWVPDLIHTGTWNRVPHPAKQLEMKFNRR